MRITFCNSNKIRISPKFISYGSILWSNKASSQTQIQNQNIENSSSPISMFADVLCISNIETTSVPPLPLTKKNVEDFKY